MKRTKISEIFSSEKIGSQHIVMGWVRTKRDSKGGFSFIELNDGSCLSGLQVIADVVAQVEAAGIPAERIVLGGFSQGACLAAEFVACDRIIACHFDTFGFIKVDHQAAIEAFRQKG